LSIFSNLVDSVLDYYVDYEINNESYVVHCRIISSVKNVNYPSYESCDMLTCISAKRMDGSTLSPEEWEDHLREHDLDIDFWDAALDTFIMLQLSLLTAPTGYA